MARLNQSNPFDERPSSRNDWILRAVAQEMRRFIAAGNGNPVYMVMNTTTYTSLTSSFPGTGRGANRIFFDLKLRPDDTLGLADDEFTVTR